ncbi:polymeric immunoglobulin receptor isoform X1 [Sinocyclocheilus anshuiensis]|uniref:polymeric immunoglobulin receptor isoform X1 n=1 Tax=Sinocyclocheilus anshuiensis TaxID=1608454 RepID=UPI0007B94FD2|nr:PREDICTED: polymeric immunoglobulin receptor-like isoform X1 [Sinocyclocheilus anshuiensis]
MYRFTEVRVLSLVMMMKTLLFFTICLIKGHMGDAADPVPAITGGSVIINCMYNRENAKTSAKSFCKMSGSECTTMTEEKNDLWIPEERFSMTDDKTLGLISVLIRNLTVNDSGMYRCKDGSEWFQEVKFNVEPESCCGTSEKQTAYILGTAVIHCKYPEKYKDHLKQLYKVQNGSLLSIHIVGSSTTNERFSLNINEQEHVLTVTIAYVSRHDDGVYFCGIYNNLIYTPLFSEIRLHVSDASVQSDLYIVIMVNMCLILLLAGGLSLLLLKRRCKKTQGSVSSDQRNTGDGDEVSSSAYYAMIPDSGNTTISLNTVYDTAHLPTNPSGSDFYTLAEQPQNMTCM